MATFTITTTSEQDQRILAAYRAASGNPAATGADVKAWLIQHLKSLVLNHERREGYATVDSSVNEITPT